MLWDVGARDFGLVLGGAYMLCSQLEARGLMRE
jgi:hypothetical protein